MFNTKKIHLLLTLVLSVSAANASYTVEDFQKACDSDQDMTACFLAGVAYDYGEGVKQDYQKAI